MLHLCSTSSLRVTDDLGLERMSYSCPKWCMTAVLRYLLFTCIQIWSDINKPLYLIIYQSKSNFSFIWTRLIFVLGLGFTNQMWWNMEWHVDKISDKDRDLGWSLQVSADLSETPFELFKLCPESRSFSEWNKKPRHVQQRLQTEDFNSQMLSKIKPNHPYSFVEDVHHKHLCFYQFDWHNFSSAMCFVCRPSLDVITDLWVAMEIWCP